MSKANPKPATGQSNKAHHNSGTAKDGMSKSDMTSTKTLGAGAAVDGQDKT